MKIKGGLTLRKIGTLYIVVDESFKGLDWIVKLSSAEAFLWSEISGEIDKKKLVKSMVKRYDINEKVASTDVENFLNTLKEAKVVIG